VIGPYADPPWGYVAFATLGDSSSPRASGVLLGDALVPKDIEVDLVAPISVPDGGAPASEDLLETLAIELRRRREPESVGRRNRGVGRFCI